MPIERYANFLPSTGRHGLNGVRASHPVGGSALKAGAETANWLLSRGRPLIVDGPKILPAWVLYGFHYWIQPDSAHENMVFQISISARTLRGDARSVRGTLLVQHFSGTKTINFTTGASPIVIRDAIQNLEGSAARSFTFVLYADVPLPSGDPPEPNPIYLWVHGTSMYEAPLVRLDNVGAAASTCEPLHPIYDGYSLSESIAGVERATVELRDLYYRRGALFTASQSLVQPGTVGGGLFSTTSTTYQNVFPVTCAIQNRLMHQGETTRVARVNVHARVSGGTGNVLVQMGNGSSATFNFSGTGQPGVWGTEQSINVRTDDPARWSTDGAIRGGVRDTLTVQARAGAGQSIDVDSVCIYDPSA